MKLVDKILDLVGLRSLTVTAKELVGHIEDGLAANKLLYRLQNMDKELKALENIHIKEQLTFRNAIDLYNENKSPNDSLRINVYKRREFMFIDIHVKLTNMGQTVLEESMHISDSVNIEEMWEVLYRRILHSAISIGLSNLLSNHHPIKIAQQRQAQLKFEGRRYIGIQVFDPSRCITSFPPDRRVKSVIPGLNQGTKAASNKWEDTYIYYD